VDNLLRLIAGSLERGSKHIMARQAGTGVAQSPRVKRVRASAHQLKQVAAITPLAE